MVKLYIINAMRLLLGAIMEVYCPTQFAFCKLCWLTWHKNRGCLSLMINRMLCLILIHLTLCLDIITERIFLYSPAKLFGTTLKIILIIYRMSFFIADMEILYKSTYICQVCLLLFFVNITVLCETFHVSHSVISNVFFISHILVFLFVLQGL